ncbi:MAG: CBS domain-containing protein [Candidatus Zapsychrus exili]|nr:CBS domain-containing protein [Candidatus Zapsychrus exili]
MFAKDIMTTSVITVKSDTTIKDAINMLIEIQISGLIVLDDNNDVLGVVTEKDLIVAYDFLGTTKVAISDFVCRDIISANEDTPIEEISRLFVQRNIKRVPVVDGKRLVGVVSRRDVLKCILLEEGEKQFRKDLES